MSTQPQVKPLVNRTFGLIFAAIFLLIAILPLIWANEVRMWALMVSAAFTSIALLLPRALTPLNQLWAKFGQLMHKVTNPLLMGLVFFLTVLPTGIIMRLLGKDPMNRRLDPQAQSYWIKRENADITPESFDNQF